MQGSAEFTLSFRSTEELELTRNPCRVTWCDDDNRQEAKSAKKEITV